MPAMRFTRLLALACATLLSAGCGNPRNEAAVAAALNDAANEINGMKSDLSAMQNTLDSLRTVLAKQDTTIGHLAEVAHVPITR